MSIRQLDTWVLDCYLNEVGWDGQHELIYFRTKRDAEACGEAMAERIRRRVAAHRGDQSLDWSVYKITPYESFHPRLEEAAELGQAYADEWLEGEW